MTKVKRLFDSLWWQVERFPTIFFLMYEKSQSFCRLSRCPVHARLALRGACRLSPRTPSGAGSTRAIFFLLVFFFRGLIAAPYPLLVFFIGWVPGVSCFSGFCLCSGGVPPSAAMRLARMVGSIVLFDLLTIGQKKKGRTQTRPALLDYISSTYLILCGSLIELSHFEYSITSSSVSLFARKQSSIHRVGRIL